MSISLSRVMLYLAPFIVAFFVYFQSIEFLWGKWTDSWVSTYSHGLLVLGISIYLLWERKHVVMRLLKEHSTSYFLLLVAIVFTVFWLFASLVNVVSVQILSFYLFLFAVFGAMFGSKSLKTITVPLGFLIFAIPVWDFFVPYLRSATANVSAFLVDLIGIPTFLEGTLIHIPAGTFSVEDSCSGQSYFLASMPLAALLAYTFDARPMRRLNVFIWLPVLAIVANWLRVTIIVVVGQYTNMQHSLMHDHFTLGWWIFAIFTFINMFWLRRAGANNEPREDIGPVTDSVVGDRSLKARYVIVGAITASLVLVYSAERYFGFYRDVGVPDVQFPASVGSWIRQTDAVPANLPGFNGADRTAVASYSNGSVSIDAYFAAYGRQAQGRELVQSSNELFDRKRWNSYQVQAEAITLGSQRAFLYELFDMNGANASLVYWYTVGNKTASSASSQKLLELADLLSARQGAYAMILTVRGNPAHDFSGVEDFITQLFQQNHEG